MDVKGDLSSITSDSYNSLQAITLILDFCLPHSVVAWGNIKLQKDENIVRQNNLQYVKNRPLHHI